MNLLIGLMSGADCDDDAASIYTDFTRPQNIGQLFLVVDPWRVTDRDLARQRLNGLVDRLHALEPQPGFDVVRYAGEGAAERARVREASGIPIELADIEAVAVTCEECDLPDVADRARSLVTGDWRA
jgi:LDH2 family malate/lactate/ureidoglycolate dehydrogenase